MHYFHTDHLNSTTVVTDANGHEVEELGYLPFGALLYDNVLQGGQWRSVYRFTGQEYDAEFALYNYNGRLYDPIMGRFISADPFMQNYYSPQGLNRYAYCINNPLIYVDPTGHDFLGIGGFFGDVWGGIKQGWGTFTGGISRAWNSIFGGGGANTSPSGTGGPLSNNVSNQVSQGNVNVNPSLANTSTGNNILSGSSDGFRLTLERHTWYSRAAGESSFNMGGAWMYDEATYDERVVWPTLNDHIIRTMHPYGPAWDIRSDLGGPIFAPMSGVVIDKWYNAVGGSQFKLYHGNGLETGYAHTYTGLNVGDRVNKGSYMAITDGTGRGEGPHLHLTVRQNGILVSPISIGILDATKPRWYFKK
jgi:RHS repeat-associated protein